MEKAIKYVTDKDLVEVLDYEKMRDNREIAAKELGFNTGFNDGFTDGFNDGKKEEKKIIAKNMLKENIEINTISKVTGLAKEEIEKLK